VIREVRGDSNRPHDARLPSDLMALLDGAEIDLRSVDVYAVATGPGSFTGLRIGIATMQGLAFAAGKPLVGVSGFDALARTVQGAPAIATWVDAWRGDVFAARYENDVEVEPPSVEKPDTLLARVTSPTLFIGDAVPIYADTIRRRCGGRALIAEPVTPPLAGTIAQLATEQVRAGHRPAPDDIRPLYIRRPDAERTRDARPVR
jgi:tRNA threonylcarbamoyladenosine biosynthesis protein TsaB